MYERSAAGLEPYQTSKGVFLSTLRVGDRFKMNTAVHTASPQSQPGTFIPFIMLRAIPSTV